MDDDFLEAYKQFVPQWQAPKPPIEYRVYYEPNTGKILCYTNEKIAGEYILVDAETFSCNRFDLTVKNGKLHEPEPVIGKLQPNTTGTATHVNNIGLVSRDGSGTTWGMPKHGD